LRCSRFWKDKTPRLTSKIDDHDLNKKIKFPFFRTLHHFRKETLTSQGRQIVDAVQEHLLQINSLLNAITYQLNKTSTSSIVINQQFYSTEVVLNLLAQLQTHAGDMESIILALRDSEKLEEFEKVVEERKKKKRANCLLVIGGIGMLVAGFFLAKRLGLKKLL
jgi:hypothetical protein